MSVARVEPKRRVRCAIYTRTSSEDGLELDFNSLDAQREAGESCVASEGGEPEGRGLAGGPDAVRRRGLLGRDDGWGPQSPEPNSPRVTGVTHAS